MLNTTKIEYFPWFFFWKHSLAQDTIIENLKLLDAKMSIFYSSLFVKFWLFSDFSAFRAICPFFHLNGPSIFFLVALIGLRHYHRNFEAPRCKNEHFLFVFICQILTFSAFRGKCPFFTWKVYLFLYGCYLISVRIISEKIRWPLWKKWAFDPKNTIYRSNTHFFPLKPK